jgi:hypothetical protein
VNGDESRKGAPLPGIRSRLQHDLGLPPGYLDDCSKTGHDKIANADKTGDRSKDVKASGPFAGVTPVGLTLAGTCCSAHSPEDLVSTKTRWQFQRYLLPSNGERAR